VFSRRLCACRSANFGEFGEFLGSLSKNGALSLVGMAGLKLSPKSAKLSNDALKLTDDVGKKLVYLCFIFILFFADKI